jgi:hypothetical protein
MADNFSSSFPFTVQVFFTLFFAQVIVGCIAQCIGPIKQMTSNSRFYSALRSPRLTGATLPHVTIQCPVYKEGLEAVIRPTVQSIKQAMSTYELQGGSANMLINDDGMQLIDEQERQERIEFYADNSIGWTARPKHNPAGGFTRKGKFKKVSSLCSSAPFAFAFAFASWAWLCRLADRVRKLSCHIGLGIVRYF